LSDDGILCGRGRHGSPIVPLGPRTRKNAKKNPKKEKLKEDHRNSQVLDRYIKKNGKREGKRELQYTSVEKEVGKSRKGADSIKLKSQYCTDNTDSEAAGRHGSTSLQHEINFQPVLRGSDRDLS
jgi:hypothetical protein